ncbi:MAG: glycoside hydrolase family 97 catalytic domain-containing protein [Bacteroidaceae bacterium]|nr:glycoside hydrolase family 97 catalytic domain-containing protein [Bacteroidaceae bacterium]
MKRILLLAAFAVSFLCQISAQSQVYDIKSPDKKICFSVKVDQESNLLYKVSVSGKDVIGWSNTGYRFEEGATVDYSKFKPIDSRPEKVKSTWNPVWGKRSTVRDIYRTQSFFFPFESNAGGLDGVVVFAVKVYNEGVAFRTYLVHSISTDDKPIPDIDWTATEHTDFMFADDYTAWYYNGERHNIGPEKLSDASGERLPLMTIKAADDLYLAIHEASLSQDGWPMRLSSESGQTKFSVIPEKIKCDSDFMGAWRVIMIGHTPGDLVDSHLIELLNPEPYGDYSWVRPGVYLWDWRIDGAVWEGYHYGMNYDSWTRMIDFAAEQGFQGLVLDANWYGPEFEKDSDPTKGDKARDVQRIIKYGKDKGVGVWLYLNDVAGTNYPIEETLAQYEEWGASGVKYGFMNGNPQQKNRKTQEITALCAKHHLMVDYHDYPVHPFGQMRTWPNAITREYCKAQLDGRQIFQPKTFVTSAFVNMVAGPIDQNNGFLELHQGRTTRKDNNQEVPSTVTGEIARTLITWSGATVIPDIPEYYRKYPALLEFLSAEKQPWQESITLAGEIGEYIVMARQNKDGEWLIGAATNEDEREIEVPLSFLGKGKFTAIVSTDADDTHYRTNRETYRTEAPQTVNRKSVLELKLAPGGGACVLIVPGK